MIIYHFPSTFFHISISLFCWRWRSAQISEQRLLITVTNPSLVTYTDADNTRLTLSLTKPSIYMLDQIGSDWFRSDRTGSDRIGLDQIGSDWIRSVWTRSDPIRQIRRSEWMLTIHYKLLVHCPSLRSGSHNLKFPSGANRYWLPWQPSLIRHGYQPSLENGDNNFLHFSNNNFYYFSKIFL